MVKPSQKFFFLFNFRIHFLCFIQNMHLATHKNTFSVKKNYLGRRRFFLFSEGLFCCFLVETAPFKGKFGLLYFWPTIRWTGLGTHCKAIKFSGKPETLALCSLLTFCCPFWTLSFLTPIICFSPSKTACAPSHWQESPPGIKTKDENLGETTVLLLHDQVFVKLLLLRIHLLCMYVNNYINTYTACSNKTMKWPPVQNKCHSSVNSGKCVAYIEHVKNRLLTYSNQN